MAYFAADDLQECVRNGFIVEDSTSLCEFVLPKVKPKARPGGLPLGFREQSNQYDSDDEPASPGFRINLTNDEWLVKDSIVPSKLSKQNKHDKTNGKVVMAPKSTEILPYAKITPTANPQTSLLSKLMETQSLGNSNPFDEFAKFDVAGKAPLNTCKEFEVIVPFVEPTEEELAARQRFVIKLSIPLSATVGDLVGLCCYLYTKAGRQPVCTNESDYQLHIADEGEVDTDFPRIDPNIKICRCFFTSLALIRKSDIPGYGEAATIVTVHLIHGGIRYQIEVESHDTVLEEIRDEAVRRRNLDFPPKDAGLARINDFVLEVLSKPGEPIKLASTIANVNSTEFVLIRKNSSRGDFKPVHSVPRHLDRSQSAQLIRQNQSPQGPQSAGLIKSAFANHRNENGNMFVFPPTDLDEPTEFSVERLHKIRPKWCAKLTIHEDALEVTPLNIERRRGFVTQSSPKITFLDFDVIASVYLSSDKPQGRRQIKIIWLWAPTEKMHEFYTALKETNTRERIIAPQSVKKSTPKVPTIEEDVEFERPPMEPSASVESDASRSRRSSRNSTDKIHKRSDMCILYEGTRWKTLQLEAKDDDSWAICVKLNAIFEANYSHVRKVYEHSRNGSKSPADSAVRFDKTLLERNPELPEKEAAKTLPNSQTPTGKTRRKFSVNPMPILSRMISRHD